MADGDLVVPEPPGPPKDIQVRPPVQGPLAPGGPAGGPPGGPPPAQPKGKKRFLGFIFGAPSGPGRGVPTRVPKSLPPEFRGAGRGSFGQPIGAPAPGVAPGAGASVALPGVDGLRPTGRGFRALAFTGRGWAGVVSAFEIWADPKVRRRKVGPVPLRGLVRDFNYAVLGVDDTVGILPVWSYSPDVGDLTLGELGGDVPLLTTSKPETGTMRGYTIFMSGGRPLANPNYLLPDSGVYLGVHVYNLSAGSVVYEANFEVLEVA